MDMIISFELYLVHAHSTLNTPLPFYTVIDTHLEVGPWAYGQLGSIIDNAEILLKIPCHLLLSQET